VAPPDVSWTFLTNHARALVYIAREPGTKVREVADCLDVSERSAHRIVNDLVEAGYLTRHRLGRRSYYEVHPERPLRHDAEHDREVGDLLRALLPEEPSSKRSA
jgi:DNA-binding IclR family transcriptional regulator